MDMDMDMGHGHGRRCGHLGHGARAVLLVLDARSHLEGEQRDRGNALADVEEVDRVTLVALPRRSTCASC
jgi:hypothetical protein|tara:strand:- start:860 stop:1069 length:210 start_codon:yes stop_codon:yes gene_type:complete